MAGSESDIQSFIIKIWLESDTAQPGLVGWRGHITHVPSGDRRYVQTLDDVTAFMLAYLKNMGGNFDPTWQAKAWWSRWLKRLKFSK